LYYKLVAVRGEALCPGRWGRRTPCGWETAAHAHMGQSIPKLELGPTAFTFIPPLLSPHRLWTVVKNSYPKNFS
jgi:hypothetical protein